MKKRISIYLICFCIQVFSTLSAQLVHVRIDNVINVECNRASLGSAKVTVTNPNHTPYTFQWSNGQNTTGVITSTATNLEAGTYTVTITDSQDGDFGSAEVTITESECEVIPEPVFTPNGDGYNDSWFIDKAQYFDDMWVLVYNRLGQKVFDSRGVYTAWEGKDLFGGSLPDASYYYVIYPNRTDKSRIVKGSVSIVR